MPVAPFPVQPELTQIALAYRNPAYIADRVLPRVPVAKEVFKWLKHDVAEGYSIPNTQVGRKGRTNEVEFKATEQESSTRDYGLEFNVPMDDIINAQAPNLNYDPMAKHTELTSELILLDREKRVADVVFAAATYPVGLKTTLAGDTQWSDVNSNPVKAILEACDLPLLRPNVLVISQAVATALRQHPKVVAAVFGNGGNAQNGGVVSMEALRQVLELEEIVIGQAFSNTAKPGQTASFSRLWGKHAALIHRNPQAAPEMGVTFGMTAQWGGRVAYTWEDRNVGLRGGMRGKVGESVREIVTCPDVGYFFENAIA